MSATEYVFKDSEYILREVIKSISKYDGFFLAFSTPNQKIKKFLYKKLLTKKKIIHFAVEQQFARKKWFLKIEKIYLLKKLYKK